jgi:hypothetical protein
MAGIMFDHGAKLLLDGTIDWGADTIKARLSRTSENAIDQAAEAMTGLGLSATDVTLGTKSGPTENHTDHRVEYRAGDPTFASVAAGAEVDKIIVFKFVTDDAGSVPIAVVDITAITPNGGDIMVVVDAAGLFYLQG